MYTYCQFLVVYLLQGPYAENRKKILHLWISSPFQDAGGKTVLNLANTAWSSVQAEELEEGRIAIFTGKSTPFIYLTVGSNLKFKDFILILWTKNSIQLHNRNRPVWLMRHLIKREPKLSGCSLKVWLTFE